MRYITALIVCLTILASCKKNPDPEPGFTEFFYVKFNFQNQEILIQDNDIQPMFLYSGGPKAGWLNSFNSPDDSFQADFFLQFDKNPIPKSDIKNLEGKTISADGSSFPYMRVVLVDSAGIFYSNDRENVDFGSSNFVIDEVIKGPRIEVYDEKKRSYILRGSFEFNVINENDLTLHPLTNGEFSMRIYIED